jgi:exopolysaccharide biosynthesis polyprenyl glycosylphosphotransferase
MIRLFRVSIPASVLVLVLSDAILIALCYAAALFVALNALVDPWFYLRYEGGWLQVLFAVAIIQIGLYFMDLYEDLHLRSHMFLVQKLCLCLGVSFLVQALTGYVQSSLLQLPQWTMVIGSVAVLLLLPPWRSALLSLQRKALPDKKLLFLGMSPVVEETIRYVIGRPNLGFSVLGYLDENATFNDVPCLGQPKDLRSAIVPNKPDVVVIDQHKEDTGWMAVLLELRSAGVKIEEAAEIYEMVFGRVSLRDLRPQTLFARESGLQQQWSLQLQAVYSFSLGLIGLLGSLPVMALVFLAVKFSSPGPAFYRQLRVGQNGATFYLYKFRSMYIDAEARTGPVWATKNDPRITPVGRWLRLLRLDELPQFFNVIRGEMALVGPRPERPEFCTVLEKALPFYQQRHLVKPGITGWAQINHKYTETIEDTTTKLEYDLYYVKHLAPTLDAYIIFHTLKVMLLSKGAQ